MKSILYDGYRFTMDNKTGYYLSTKPIGKSRKRLHVYIWEKHYGKIPKGAQVHHIDGNKASTDVDNMELLTASEHMHKHWKEKTPEEVSGYRERIVKNCTSKAKEWHSTEEGRKWHSEHGKAVAEKVVVKEFICEYCGAVFKTKPYGKVLYCSNKCKAAARRASGVDNEQRTCVECGKIFETNKYNTTNTCSRSCANKKWHRDKQAQSTGRL